MRIIKDFLFIPLLLICSLTYAAPAQISISQNLTTDPHDSVFVLSSGDSSFGTKSTATPQFWDNFEDGSVDTSANYGTWQQVQSLNLTTGNVRHVNSTYAATDNIQTAGTRGVQSDNSILSRKWFISFWVYCADNFDFATSGNLSNVKWLRFWHPTRDENIYFDFNNGDLDGWGKHTCEYISDPGYQNNWFDITKNGIDDGSWHNFQVEFLDSSGVNQSDGVTNIWLDGAYIDGATGLKIKENYSENKRVSHMGFYNSTGTGSDGADDVIFDDFYADTTWARVELGDQPVYNDCEQREMQIPTAWATDEITFVCNQGSFVSPTNMYIFVTDDDGAVSPGLSVSGAGGAAPGEADTTPPSIGGKKPASGASGQSQTTSIIFVASDDSSGVDVDSLTASNAVSVSGVSYASGLAVTGTKASYTCTLDTDDYGVFQPGETVTVGVNISDLSSNGVLETWSFTIEDNTFRQGGETITLGGETLTLP